MGYKEFCEYVKEHITEYLPVEFKNCEVTISQQRKNNNIMLEALSIRGKSSVVPVLYLPHFYNLYQNGYSMEQVMENIADTYVLGSEQASGFDIRDFQFEKLKDNIFVTVQNAEMNKEQLEDIPHEIREDLALVYRVRMQLSDSEQGNVLIHNSHLERWGIDADLLKETAWNNMHNQFQPEFISMEELLKQLCGFEEFPSDALPTDIYVLSNRERQNGAVYMFDEEVMSKIADALDTDIIVLPSSVHEAILLRKKEEMNYESLRDMVNEINSTQVSPEEFLSNEVYEFKRDGQTLTRIIIAEQTQGMSMSM